MKHFALLFGLCALFAVAGCSDDDEGKSYSAKQLEGLWQCVESSYVEKENGVITDQDTDVDMRIEFRDGTYQNYEYNPYRHSWEKRDYGTYKIKGNKLIMTAYSDYTGEGESSTAIIDSLTDQELKISASEKYREGGVTYEFSMHATYNKINVNE